MDINLPLKCLMAIKRSINIISKFMIMAITKKFRNNGYQLTY